MKLKPSGFLSFLQTEISQDFEIVKENGDQVLISSSDLNVLVTWKPYSSQFNLTISKIVQDEGQQYAVHVLNDHKWLNILTQWSKIMIPYLLDDEVVIRDTSSIDIANLYCDELKDVKLPLFEDPDKEVNYAISKLGSIELECLNLFQTKQCWFEITNTDIEPTDQDLVRQISVPMGNRITTKNYTAILDLWLKCHLTDLNPIEYKKYSSNLRNKSKTSQFVVIALLFLFWLLAVRYAPS